MKLPFLTSIVLLVAGSVNCSSQLLSEADIAKLAQECTNEYKKIQSVQAHGTRTKSGGMFAPPDPEFSRSTTRSAPSDDSVPNTFALYTAFKGEIVRHSEVRIEASQPKVDGKHSLERFNNYRPTNIYTSPKSFSSVGVLSTANTVSVSNRVRMGVSLLGMGFALTALVLWLQPRRTMNSGGCGPRALLAVARQFGCTQTEAQTLARFPNNGFEVTLSQLQAAAPKFGLHAATRQMTVPQLRAERPLGVLHIDAVHFVALVGYDGDRALIVDPLYRDAVRPVRWFLDDLTTRWSGAILVVTPQVRK